MARVEDKQKELASKFEFLTRQLEEEKETN